MTSLSLFAGRTVHETPHRGIEAQAHLRIRCSHARIQREDWESGRQPPKNHKAIGSLSNTCPDPQKNKKATKPDSILGYHWPASETPAFSGIWILSLLINSKSKKKTNKQKTTTTKNKQTTNKKTTSKLVESLLNNFLDNPAEIVSMCSYCRHLCICGTLCTDRGTGPVFPPKKS